MLTCTLYPEVFFWRVSHQVAAWYSSNQNDGLQRPEKAYFALWIKGEKLVAVFRFRFHTKIRKKGGVSAANCLRREVICVRNKERVVEESVCIYCLTTFYQFSWQATEILARTNRGLQFTHLPLKTPCESGFLSRLIGWKFCKFLNKNLKPNTWRFRCSIFECMGLHNHEAIFLLNEKVNKANTRIWEWNKFRISEEPVDE
jgi:hypothetical protein